VRWRSRHPWLALTIATLVLASCSSDDDSSGGGTAPASPDATAVTFSGRSPDEITAPTVEGDGILRPQPSPTLPEGYVEEELFVAGTATSFEAAETPDDGFWTATPAEEAEYRTRVIVRRPPAQEFSGTVLLEWFNVSAVESSPDWAYLFEEIGRARHAYIGVSTQSQGVEGGETLLDVDVDEETASSLGASADQSGLKNIDPARYGDLDHPGDAFAYDIFSQVARAAAASNGELLGGLEPEQVLAVGESQSAAFLTTLANAVHPLDPTFDGFFIHSRGAGAAPLAGELVAEDIEDDEAEGDDAEGDDDEGDDDASESGVLVRTDLDVPVLLLETETDLTLLQYARARQPDTDFVRTWEVAGTAHADAHLLRSMLGGPRDPSIASIIGCTQPINTGPHHEVLQAALSHVVDWTAGGPPPPEGTRLELVDGDEIAIARDEHDIALGGVRNPLVDVPVATLTGDPPGSADDDLEEDGGGVCTLFGETIPFDQAELVDLYGSADAYLEAFRTSADEAVDAGFLLRGDADQLIAEAEANRALFD
jgi:hypothetical protein